MQSAIALKKEKKKRKKELVMAVGVSRQAEFRRSQVFKSLNRPLTILGAERRLFFVSLVTSGAIFSLMHSLLGGMLVFAVGVVAAQRLTRYDVELLRVLLNSAKFRTRYDPMKSSSLEIVIRRRNVQD
jgi:type IV secretory pathway TrbD component